MSHILMDGMLILLLGGHVVLCGRHFSNLVLLSHFSCFTQFSIVDRLKIYFWEDTWYGDLPTRIQYSNLF